MLAEQRYYAFGATRLVTGEMEMDKLFTGQREMAGLGLYHYGARFYYPALGRFISADTIVPEPGNPQSSNRFSYVRNNPLRYTDPTGHRECGMFCDPSEMSARPSWVPTERRREQAYTPKEEPEEQRRRRPSAHALGPASAAGTPKPSASEWRGEVLGHLATAGPSGQYAAEYIRREDTQILFTPQSSTGAGWWGGDVYLNSIFFSLQTSRDDPTMLGKIAHEALHLEQHFWVALSVYGEQSAHQVESNVYMALTGDYPGHNEKTREDWEELSSIPPSLSRDDLRRARGLMQTIGDTSYARRMAFLPLYPWHMEIAYLYGPVMQGQLGWYGSYP